eukprot:3610051-Amphidinium_carterae.1
MTNVVLASGILAMNQGGMVGQDLPNCLHYDVFPFGYLVLWWSVTWQTLQSVPWRRENQNPGRFKKQPCSAICRCECKLGKSRSLTFPKHGIASTK